MMASLIRILSGIVVLIMLGCNSKRSPTKTVLRNLNELYNLTCSTASRNNKIIGGLITIESKSDNLMHADQLEDLQNEFRTFNGEHKTQLYNYFGCLDVSIIPELANKKDYNIWVEIEQPPSKNTVSRVFAIRNDTVLQYFELTTSGSESY